MLRPLLMPHNWLTLGKGLKRDHLRTFVLPQWHSPLVWRLWRTPDRPSLLFLAHRLSQAPELGIWKAGSLFDTCQDRIEVWGCQDHCGVSPILWTECAGRGMGRQGKKAGEVIGEWRQNPVQPPMTGNHWHPTHLLASQSPSSWQQNGHPDRFFWVIYK